VSPSPCSRIEYRAVRLYIYSRPHVPRSRTSRLSRILKESLSCSPFISHSFSLVPRSRRQGLDSSRTLVSPNRPKCKEWVDILVYHICGDKVPYATDARWWIDRCCYGRRAERPRLLSSCRLFHGFSLVLATQFEVHETMPFL
jgi:hypothetical protein